MDEKKILIANISKGRIGEDNSRLLGALVITKLQLAAMSRVDILEDQRKDFYLYVDEFQNFATDAFINILSEARKYRLNLILANQYLGQLEEMTPTGGKNNKVGDAVFGNVGTIISFRVGAEDAEFLEKEFLPDFEATDFVNLAKYNIYLKLMVNGIAGRPFSAQTLSPFQKLEISNAEKIIKVSRERYGTSRKVVDDKIIKWTGNLEEIKSSDKPAQNENALYDAQCSLCKKWTKVIFPPDGKRPVYCKTCLKKVMAQKDAAKQKQVTKQPEQEHQTKIVVSCPPESKNPMISLEQAVNNEPVSFSMTKKNNTIKERTKRKEVNIDELKRVLDESLRKNNNQSENKEQTKDENLKGI